MDPNEREEQEEDNFSLIKMLSDITDNGDANTIADLIERMEQNGD